VALAGVAGVAFVIGVAAGASHGDDRLKVAERFARSWARGDYAAMYAQLTDDARRRVPMAAFRAAYEQARETATTVRLRPGKARMDGDDARLRITVRTRIFGTLHEPLDLPLSGSGADAKVDWRRNLVFPGLRPGDELTRTTRLPTRATLLTRDGGVLAKGDDRTPDPALADVAAQTVGELGPVPPERAGEARALGVPDGTKLGLSGLERALDPELVGRPGGVLRAGTRVLAAVAPEQAPAVRTTVAPDVERAAVAAMAGRLGGVVALDPRTGEVLAFAGIAFSGLQPPGSTFKMITLAGALRYGVAKPADTFPVQTAATLSGVELSNANGESCGGTLVNAFAVSCNSVFAPLGVKLGPDRLVQTAEAFGFNRPPGIPGAATSTIPAPDQIGDDLAVGATAIGQGRVQATALQMATVAATVGLRGRTPRLFLDLRAARRADAPAGARAIPSDVAREEEKMMLAVVRYGTGTAAAVSGVKVAGKTGTAELKTTHECRTDPDEESNPEQCAEGAADDPTDTDAWFAAYAPAGDGHPRVAVGVMLVRAGAGGDTAAPVARQVLTAALKR
jgi:cell division protein FtsI/penicillin-binding protein 2